MRRTFHPLTALAATLLLACAAAPPPPLELVEISGEPIEPAPVQVAALTAPTPIAPEPETAPTAPATAPVETAPAQPPEPARVQTVIPPPQPPPPPPSPEIYPPTPPATAPEVTPPEPGALAPHSEVEWRFVVDGQVLDFPSPMVAAEPGQSLHVALTRADETEPRWATQTGLASTRVTAGQERVHFRMVEDFAWEASAGSLDPGETVNTVHWEVPQEPTIATLSVQGLTAGEADSTTSGHTAQRLRAEGEQLTVQVLTPFDRTGLGTVGAYPLGVYPNETATDVPAPVARRPEAYLPPGHFWHVTEETRDAHIAPHIRLGDLCSVPRVNGEAYIAVKPALIAKLTALREACAERGFLADDGGGLVILRGYVSPTRHAQLRQAGAGITRFTRHLYGDAAVVIIDVDGDGRMDDLNRDASVNRSDADLLASVVETLEPVLGQGGLGVYGGRPEGDPELPDTPMVQFDCRGERARW